MCVIMKLMIVVVIGLSNCMLVRLLMMLIVMMSDDVVFECVCYVLVMSIVECMCCVLCSM